MPNSVSSRKAPRPTATALTPGQSSGKRTLARYWRGRSRRHVVGRDVVHRDEPLALDLAEQAGVHALGDARAALEPILANQHRGVRSEQVDLHIVEVELAAPFCRSAIIAHIMVERALPALLELAAG